MYDHNWSTLHPEFIWTYAKSLELSSPTMKHCVCIVCVSAATHKRHRPQR